MGRAQARQNGAGGVGVEVQIRHVLDRHVALGHVGVIFRSTTATGLERRGGGQDRQAFVFGALHHLRDVPRLGNRHDLHGRVIRHQREIAVQGGVGLAHGAADIGQRCVVFRLHRGQNLGIAFHQRGHAAVFVAFGDRPRFRGGARDAPAVAVAFQHQVDQPHVAAPEPTHGGRFAVDGACVRVNGGIVGVGGRGEHKVAVSGHDRVDAVHGGQRDGCVLHALGVICRPDARMGQGDDDVGALFLHLWYIFPRGLYNIAGLNVAFQMAAVPVHDLRRHEADQPDLDRVAVARAVGNHPVDQHIGFDQRGVLCRAAAHFLDHVR